MTARGGPQAIVRAIAAWVAPAALVALLAACGGTTKSYSGGSFGAGTGGMKAGSGGSAGAGTGGMKAGTGGGGAPPGKFDCSGIYCDIATEICFLHTPVADGPSSSECRPSPSCDAGGAGGAGGGPGTGPCACASEVVTSSDGCTPSSYCSTTDGATTYDCEWI